jgi:Fe-Mn family superoxide dismutase
MSYIFKELPYAFDALEPHIDARTMEIHYTKHHRAYFDKFTAAVSGTGMEGKSLQEIFANISQLPAAVRNNGGGYYNHELFWNFMGPNGGGMPSGDLGKSIEKAFGSFETFKAQFSDAAANRFGSGWAWLIVTPAGDLKVVSTANQDNTLMDIAEIKGIPVLGLDVWEHAYYLKYQNRRPEYITAFWNVVDWAKVSEFYNKALAVK